MGSGRYIRLPPRSKVLTTEAISVVVGMSKHMELSRLIRSFWLRKGSFWAKLSSVIVALCVFSIVFSSSWTYRHSRSVSAMRVQQQDQKVDVHVVVPRVHGTFVTPPQLILSESEHSDPVTVPVFEADDEQGAGSTYEQTQPEGEVETLKNMSTLIIGILSEPVEDVEFRNTARATWLRSAQAPGVDIANAVFFFTQQYAADPALQREVEQHGDIVFGDGDSSMPVAYQMMDQLSQQYSVRHILRVGVRSYVAVDRLLDQLETLCERSGCAGEDIWAGRMITNREIPEEDKWYMEDTGLSMYLPYMSSDAYVLSASLAQSLSLMHSSIGLKLYGGEGETLGMWLIPIAARRIDFGASVHLESTCCFTADGVATFDICARVAEQYPVIMGAFEKPEYLEQYHNALKSCLDKKAVFV